MSVIRLTALIILFPLFLTSCLQHQFSFTITEDGILNYEYGASGDSLDLYDGFILLPEGMPWIIEKSFEIDSSGESTDTIHHYRAKNRFADPQAIPASFGLEHLEFASLTMEHPLRFKRQNLFFMVNYLFDLRFTGRNKTTLYLDPGNYIPEECAELENPDSLSAERREYLEKLQEDGYKKWYVNLLQKRFFSSLEHSCKMHPEIQFDSTKIELAETSLQEYLNHLLTKDYFEEISSETDLWNFVFHPGYDILEEKLNFLGDTTFFVDMRTAGEMLTREYNATEDLSDDTFLIELNMPGNLKSANADSTTADQTLIWQFNGEDFADSTIVMTAVSTIYYSERLYIAGGILLLIIVLAALKQFKSRASDA